jgi:uncharacterized protein (TIGR00369 family)
MNDIIEVSDEDQFANGQVSCDLRVNSDATESETQLGADNAIEQCPDVASEEFPAPIGKLLGLMITSSGTGRATVDFEADGRYANPMGTLHGGVLCDLADAAMDVAYLSTLAERETFTTIELKINFLRPVWIGEALCSSESCSHGQDRRPRRMRHSRRAAAACRARLQHLYDAAGTARRRALGNAESTRQAKVRPTHKKPRVRVGMARVSAPARAARCRRTAAWIFA